MPTRHTATLVRREVTPSGRTVFLYFQPEHPFVFTEGQFVMIETHERTPRKKPYSIATTHQLMQLAGEIGFVVKQTSDQGMSAFLTQEIDIGAQVTFIGPVGHYVDRQQHKNYLLVSTGSGLGPNLAWHERLVHSGDFDKIVHLYGERTIEELLPSTIGVLASSANVVTRFYMSRSPQGVDFPTDDFRHGYVQDGLHEALSVLGTTCTVAICGQPNMVVDVRQRLIDMGVPSECIVVEKY